MVNLTGGGLSGGYRKYLAQLTPRLAASPDVEALEVFVPSAAPVAQHQPWHRFTDARQLRERVGAARPDVVFVPTARWPALPGVPTVVMVRNMEPLVCPWSGNSAGEGLKNLARAWAARRACRLARRVIAVSGAVRDLIRQRWRVPEDRIGVVPHGVDEAARIEPRRPPQVPAEWAGTFLFTAGSLRPARGLDDLQAALHGADAPPGPLVIAGAPTPDAEGWARQQRSRFESTGHTVLWTGNLNAAEMAWCFRSARAFIMTSRAEACPNIVLEAMAHGALSISTRTPPMPEFYGPAALYYDAGDGASLRSLLWRVSRREEEFGGLREAARRRAEEYNWDRTASRTLAELEEAIHAA